MDLTEFEVEPMPLDESLGQTADNDVAAIEAINEVFELQEPIETEADETEAAETSSEAIEVVEDANDESVADAGNSIEDTQDSPAATDFTEPAAGGTPANVWRAAQSDWFGLESDTPPATNTPAGGSPPSDVPDEPKSNAREVEVIIPDVLSIRPDQAANVDVHLAEPLDVFSNHSNDDGPVVVPQVPESNDDWVSAPIKVASAEPVVEPTVAPKVVEAKLIKAEVMPKSAPTSARSDQFDELAQIDPAAEFNALADRSHGQVGGPNQPDDGDVILVVDDSPTVRKLIAMTLEKRGYKVATAFDGVAAIKEIVSHNPALILMDVTMPRLDGYQLCKLVKKYDSTRHIPVVMLTGKDGMFDRLRGRLVGCSGYITKPFVPDDLVATVEQFLTAAKQKR